MLIPPSPKWVKRTLFRFSLKTLLWWGFAILMPCTLVQLAYHIFQKDETALLRPRDYYDVKLARLNDMEKLCAFIDSLAKERKIAYIKNPEYVSLTDSIIKQRFYYGRQNIPFASNFIANLCGKYIWDHLWCKVEPDDILKGQKAFCSQSSIVFQEVLKTKGYDIRTVKLPGHFCTEVFFNEKWNFFDVSYKPSFASLGFFSTNEMMEHPSIIADAYLYSFNSDFLAHYDSYFDKTKVHYGEVNAFAAPNMLIFQRISRFVSWFGWLVLLCMIAAINVYESYVKKSHRIKENTIQGIPEYVRIDLPYESDRLGSLANIKIRKPKPRVNKETDVEIISK